MNPLSVLIPFEKKDELKLRYKLKWNDDTKLWECRNERIYNMNGMFPYHIEPIIVSFKNKENAKKLGCKWFPKEKFWYISLGAYNLDKPAYDALSSKANSCKTSPICTNNNNINDDEFLDDVVDDL
jgi:hypothetical protein